MRRIGELHQAAAQQRDQEQQRGGAAHRLHVNPLDEAAR
jgi:hypothetical protein